jgi:hypothetical protein
MHSRRVELALFCFLGVGCDNASSEQSGSVDSAVLDSDTVAETGVDDSISMVDSGATETAEGDAGGIVPGPVDAIIAAMPEGSWKELPGTNMADTCPPPYSSYPCDAVMIAWSGGAYDTLRDRLVVWGGGHDDSPYNNVFTFDLASMKWKRWTELPKGMTGSEVAPIFRDKRVETCGLYPSGDTLTIPDAWLTATGYLMPEKCDDPSIVSQLDAQQPRSAHTYGNVAFSAATGRFYILGSIGTYPSGQSSTGRVMGFDFGTSKWVRGANNPVVDYGTSAADGKGHLWYVGGHKLHEYDPVADSWTAHPPDGEGYYYAGADVDTKRNVLAMTRAGDTVSTYALSDAAKTHATVTTTGLATPLSAPGFAYSPVLDRFFAWSGTRSVPVLDLAAAKWTTIAGTGDDPGAQASNGTYGRFRYSPSRKVFVVVSGTKKNVFLFKPPAVAP